MLLMVEKGIRVGICIDNKYMKDYDKNKESSYLQYIFSLYGWAMSQKIFLNYKKLY